MRPDDDHSPVSSKCERKSGLIAWAFYDWANSAFFTLIQTFVFATYFVRMVAENETIGTALWGYLTAATGLIIALGGPVLGAMADQGGRRKPWIAAFTLLSVIATAGLWFVAPTSGYVYLALVLVGLGTLGAEFANIFYNAMLPSLASPDRIGRWSGWGWGFGYAGGLFCLAVALLGFVGDQNAWFDLDREASEHVRATFFLTAVWMLVFSVPLLLMTPDTPSTGKTFSQSVVDGLRQLLDSARHVRRYRYIVRFLIAWMFYTNGLLTLFMFGGVYAAGTFDMSEADVLKLGITLNLAAGLGAALFAWVDDWIGAKATIMLSLVGLIVPGTLILLVHSPAAFWSLGIVIGAFVGPAQAASRSYLARAAPEALRTEMFGLYALSGKATAFLGPLLVGWLTHLTGSQRVGMAPIVVFLAIGLLIMFAVPPPRRAQRL
ncbi:MAG: MFS transporter [Gammaproteobacteria bacterium]